jgi:hypothetical protein
MAANINDMSEDMELVQKMVGIYNPDTSKVCCHCSLGAWVPAEAVPNSYII